MSNLAQKNMTKITTKIIGVGGFGDFVLNQEEFKSVTEVISINTDKQSQATLPDSITKICISDAGTGTGANPEIGYKFALDRREQLISLLEGTDIVFLVAGIGKGTGTGATAYLTELTKELGIYSVVILRSPEMADGEFRIEKSSDFKNKIIKNSGAYIDINNDNVIASAISIGIDDINEAYKLGNQAVVDAVRGLVSIVNNFGSRNVDLEDFKATVKGSFAIKTGEYGKFNTDLSIYALESKEARTALSVIELPTNSSDSLKKTMQSRKSINDSIDLTICSQITGIINNPDIDEVSIIYVVSGFEKTLSEIRSQAGLKGAQARFNLPDRNGKSEMPNNSDGK